MIKGLNSKELNRKLKILRNNKKQLCKQRRFQAMIMEEIKFQELNRYLMIASEKDWIP
jgi:hypothetical protein